SGALGGARAEVSGALSEQVVVTWVAGGVVSGGGSFLLQPASATSERSAKRFMTSPLNRQDAPAWGRLSPRNNPYKHVHCVAGQIGPRGIGRAATLSTPERSGSSTFRGFNFEYTLSVRAIGL